MKYPSSNNPYEESKSESFSYVENSSQSEKIQEPKDHTLPIVKQGNTMKVVRVSKVPQKRYN